jgi:hypothetical protein
MNVSSIGRICWADFALKSRGFGKTSGEEKSVKSFESTTYEA